MTIIEQARELLAYPGAADAKGTMVVPAADVAALCRALIVRTDALQRLLDAEDALDADPSGGTCERYKAAYRAARRALADEPHTGQGD